MLGLHILNGEFAGPLALDEVESVLLPSLRVQGSCETVLLSRKPSATAVVDFGSVSGGRLDVGTLVEFDEGRTGDESLDV